MTGTQQLMPLRHGRYLGLVSVVGGILLLSTLWPVIQNRVALPTRSSSDAIPLHFVRRDASLAAPYRADTAAYGRYLLASLDLDEGRVASARRRFQALVNDQPLYAPGWAGHAVALYRSGFTDVPPREAMRSARSAAQRAMAMDSTLADALETMAAVELFGHWNLRESRRRIDAALRLYPADADLLNLLGVWYRWSGDQQAALRLKQRAHELDPLSRRYAIQVAWSYYLGHRCAEAVQQYRRLPPEVRRVARADIGLYRSLRCEGDIVGAAALLQESARASGDSALALLFDGPLTPRQRDHAIDEVFRHRLAAESSARQAGWTPPEGIARLYAERQMADSALLWLDSMYVDRSMMLYTVPIDPLYDFLRNDPRFRSFLRKLPWLTVATQR